MKTNKQINKSATFSIIFLTVFIDLLGFGLLIPLIPTFATKNLGVSDFSVGMVIATFSLMQFLFNPILGRLSDRTGRRPIIIYSLLLTSGSYLLFSFANSFFLLILSRLLAGIGSSNIGAAQAYIADITDKHERSRGMGMIGAAFGLGFLFGPVIGGYLSQYGYDVVGYTSAALSFAAFLFAFFALPESKLEKHKETPFSFKLVDIKFTLKVLREPIVGMIIIISFILIFSMANIHGTFSLLGYKYYKFTDAQNGYLFGIMGLVSTLVQGVLIKFLSDKISERHLVITGIIFMIIGLGMIPYGVNFLGVAIAIGTLSIGSGILQPVVLSLVSKYSPDNIQGAVLGVNQSISAFARFLGPLWGGFSFDYFGYQFPFLTGAFFTFITLIYVAYKLKMK